MYKIDPIQYVNWIASIRLHITNWIGLVYKIQHPVDNRITSAPSKSIVFKLMSTPTDKYNQLTSSFDKRTKLSNPLKKD